MCEEAGPRVEGGELRSEKADAFFALAFCKGIFNYLSCANKSGVGVCVCVSEQTQGGSVCVCVCVYAHIKLTHTHNNGSLNKHSERYPKTLSSLLNINHILLLAYAKHPPHPGPIYFSLSIFFFPSPPLNHI